MNKQELQSLLSAMLGFSIDFHITTLGEFLAYYKTKGYDVSKKVILLK